MNKTKKYPPQKLSYDTIFSKRPNLQQLKILERPPIFALAENIRSMHNVGSIFRTSDGAGLQKLCLSGYTARPPRKEIDKTALGATESVPWEYAENGLSFITNLKTQGTNIVVVEHTNQSIPYTKAKYVFPLCIVIGNEVDGVSQEIVENADQSIEIPMFGLKQSLNVSVAYGIVLYHILDQYKHENVLKA